MASHQRLIDTRPRCTGAMFLGSTYPRLGLGGTHPAAREQSLIIGGSDGGGGTQQQQRPKSASRHDNSKVRFACYGVCCVSERARARERVREREVRSKANESCSRAFKKTKTTCESVLGKPCIPTRETKIRPNHERPSDQATKGRKNTKATPLLR